MLGKLFGLGVKEVLGTVSDTIDKFVETPEEKKLAERWKEQLNFELITKQIEVNRTEALHRSIFVAGWRPAIGWICAIALGCFYIPQFVLASYLWWRTCVRSDSITPFPISEAQLTELVVAMLGFGVYRTFEKTTGRAK